MMIDQVLEQFANFLNREKDAQAATDNDCDYAIPVEVCL
jgi:hypothetical protein